MRRMRRVALAGVLAAVGAALVVVAVARPREERMQARPFPPAAAELGQLWSSAPPTGYRFPPTLRRWHGWRQRDARLVFDAGLPYGNRLNLYVAHDAAGRVCFQDTGLGFSGGSCFESFFGEPANLGTGGSDGGSVLTGLLRDGTTGLDVELGGRWRPAHVAGRGVYLTAGGEYLGNAIQRVRYHLADGSTLTCRWERPC
jgi:hypothetical protein